MTISIGACEDVVPHEGIESPHGLKTRVSRIPIKSRYSHSSGSADDKPPETTTSDKKIPKDFRGYRSSKPSTKGRARSNGSRGKTRHACVPNPACNGGSEQTQEGLEKTLGKALKLFPRSPRVDLRSRKGSKGCEFQLLGTSMRVLFLSAARKSRGYFLTGTMMP